MIPRTRVRLGSRIAAALAVVMPALAQLPPPEPVPDGATPRLRIAFAAQDARDPAALTWLRLEVLPRLPQWPAGRAATASFSLRTGDDAAGALRVTVGDGMALPDDVVFAGECDLPGGGTARLSCTRDGREEWELDAVALPRPLQLVVDALHVELDGAPRVVDPVALVGHLTGPSAHGDPIADWLTIGASFCGEVTFAASRADTGDGLRVIGRSEGGLTLPAVLLWIAMHRPGAPAIDDQTDLLALRAFAARDGERAEAARQATRTGAVGLPTLRAMLHAEEPARLAAIDTLVRLRAAGELPDIVAAATSSMPLASAMAEVAVHDLWRLASQPTRDATRSALRQSPILDVGILDAEAWPPEPDPRVRRVGLLSVLATGLFGLLLRERRRRFC